MRFFLVSVCIFLCCGTAVEMKNIKLYQNTFDYYIEVGVKDSVVFRWAVPGANDIKKHQLVYKGYNEIDWIVLRDSIPPTNFTEIVDVNEFKQDDSVFIVGVRYVNLSGIVSEIHSSIDSTAIPNAGWILVLKK